MALISEVYHSSSESAEWICSLCYWAHLAGIDDEEIRALGKKPGAPSGHYQRHLDDVLGLEQTKDKNYKFKVSGHRKHDVSRTTFDMTFIPVHEAADADMKENLQVLEELLAEAKSNKGLPPSYFDHEVVIFCFKIFKRKDILEMLGFIQKKCLNSKSRAEKGDKLFVLVKMFSFENC